MKLFRLLSHYGIEFVRANLTIARQVLSPRLDIDPEVIEMKTGVKTPLEVLALSNLITFTPGSLTLEINPEEEKLVLHVLDDAEGHVASVRKHLEEPLLEITRKGQKR